VLDAQYFGVAQRRRRVFIVGCAGDNGAASAEILALSESLRGDSAKGKQTREDPAADAGAGAPVLLTMREGREGGGKGPLISTNQSLTLATGNGQVLISGGGVSSELPPCGAVSQEHSDQSGRELKPPRHYRQRAFGDYTTDGTAGAVKARDYKDATDLVVGQVTKGAE